MKFLRKKKDLSHHGIVQFNTISPAHPQKIYKKHNADSKTNHQPTLILIKKFVIFFMNFFHSIAINFSIIIRKWMQREISKSRFEQFFDAFFLLLSSRFSAFFLLHSVTFESMMHWLRYLSLACMQSRSFWGLFSFYCLTLNDD